tara:strand:+ start:1926 stop:2348 length:423 start_codon:yes stop_codon:yes gene_type:complete
MVKKEEKMTQYSTMIALVEKVAKQDVEGLHKSEQSYGDSWKQRGGVGAFMMLARKWDRLEKQVTEHNYDIFKTAQLDTRPEGVIDDIKDLRRYLMLVEAEILRKDNNHESYDTDGLDHPSRISHEEEDMFREDRCEWKTR